LGCCGYQCLLLPSNRSKKILWYIDWTLALNEEMIISGNWHILELLNWVLICINDNSLRWILSSIAQHFILFIRFHDFSSTNHYLPILYIAKCWELAKEMLFNIKLTVPHVLKVVFNQKMFMQYCALVWVLIIKYWVLCLSLQFKQLITCQHTCLMHYRCFLVPQWKVKQTIYFSEICRFKQCQTFNFGQFLILFQFSSSFQYSTHHWLLILYAFAETHNWFLHILKHWLIFNPLHLNLSHMIVNALLLLLRISK
jgi:hypothetical protein